MGLNLIYLQVELPLGKTRHTLRILLVVMDHQDY
jgi:hypothetical protein